ncbi:DNA repair protein rad50, partial [Quaeritorhiza haematococci]
MEDCIETERKLKDLQSRIEQLTRERELIIRNMESMRESMEVYEESDEQLQELLQSHLRSLGTKNEEVDKLEDEKSRISEELAKVQKDHSRKLTLRGQLQAEHNAHKRRVEQRASLIVELSRKHNYGSFSAETLDSEDVKRFLSRLKGDIDTLLSTVESMKLQMKDKESVLIQKIQNKKSSLASYEENKKMTRRQIESNRQKISQYMQKMQTIRVSQPDIDEAKSRLAEEESGLRFAQQNANIAEIDSRIRELSQQLQEHEFNLSKISDEMSMLNMQADTRARLALKKTEKDRKETALNQLVSSTEGEFKTFFDGRMPDQRDLGREVDKLLRAKEASIRDNEERLQKANMEVSAIDTRILMAKTNLNKKTAELEGKMKRIRDVCGDKDFVSMRSESEIEYDDQKENVASLRSAEKMYIKFSQKSKIEKRCPLCTRGFPSIDELEAFFKKVENTLEKIPASIVTAEAELTRIDSLRHTLRELQSTWDDCERLRDREIPDLKRRIETEEGLRGEAGAVVEDLASVLGCLKLELSTAQELRQKADDMSRLQREISMIENDIEKLAVDLAGSGSRKTMEEVQGEYEVTQGQIKKLRREIERLNAESRHKQKDIQTREIRLRDVRENLQKLDYKFQEREKMRGVVAELKGEVEGLTKELE